MADAERQGHRPPAGRRDSNSDASKQQRASQDFYRRRESATVQRRRSDVASHLQLLQEPLPAVGAHVVVKPRDQELSGVVRYTGNASFADGIFIGVELSEARGKHDGSVHGVKYFSCPDGHGVFVRPQHIIHMEPTEHPETADSEGSDDGISDLGEEEELDGADQQLNMRPLDLDLSEPAAIKHELVAAMEEPNLMQLRVLLPVAARAQVPESEMEAAQNILMVQTQASLINDIEDLRATMSGIVDSMKAEQGEFNKMLAPSDVNESTQMLAKRSREGIRSMQEAVMEKTEELVGLASEFVNLTNEPVSMKSQLCSDQQAALSEETQTEIAELCAEVEEMSKAKKRHLEVQAESHRLRSELQEAKHKQRETRAESDRLRGELQDALTKLLESRSQSKELEFLKAERGQWQSSRQESKRLEQDLRQQLERAESRRESRSMPDMEDADGFQERGTLLHDELAEARDEAVQHKMELSVMERQHDLLEAEASVHAAAMASRPLGGDTKARCLAMAEEYREARAANKAKQACELEQLREQVAGLRQKLKEQESALASGAKKGNAVPRGVTPPSIRSGRFPRPSIIASTSPTANEPASKPSYWEQIFAVTNLATMINGCSRSAAKPEEHADPEAVVVLSLPGDADRKVAVSSHVTTSRSPTFGNRGPKKQSPAKPRQAGSMSASEMSEPISGMRTNAERAWSRGRAHKDGN
mmetsp:Transcript_2088/g.4126  ORF Transcript_2088/g.4126 Transcript_2088/m.4126 type:complete len:705 (-) Transcript_2088:69-2183(-)